MKDGGDPGERQAGPVGGEPGDAGRAPSKVISLRDLPRELKPPHDLWPQLEARLRAGGIGFGAQAGEEPGAQPSARGTPHGRLGVPLGRQVTPLRGVPRPSQRLVRLLRPLAAVAALGAAVAAGIAIGRALLPETPAPASLAAGGSVSGFVPAYLTDPGYLRDREALLLSLNARLATLPPQSRQKVLASLATIDRSIQEIETALGREPGNALLQELLVDTYQDEMRVLTSVQDPSAGGEI